MLEQIIDILFWMDLFINMFDTYQDEDGNIINDVKVIVWNYFSSWFVIDLIACLPIDSVKIKYLKK